MMSKQSYKEGWEVVGVFLWVENSVRFSVNIKHFLLDRPTSL